MIEFRGDHLYVFFLGDSDALGPETTQEQAEQAYLNWVESGALDAEDPQQLKAFQDWFMCQFGVTDWQMDPENWSAEELQELLGFQSLKEADQEEEE